MEHGFNYNELQQRNEDLRILTSLIQAVHQSLDLQEIYKIALDRVIELDNVDIAMIYLMDETKNEAVLQDHRNLPEEYIKRAGRIPHLRGVTWKLINTGKVLKVRNAQEDPDVGPAGRELGFRSMLGIPIVLEGIIIGVIWLLSYREYPFTKSEEELLTSIGNQIAIAIAKAKLYRELSKKNRYETIVSTVTRSVHQSINLQDVLENAVDTMSRNIDNVDNVSIYLVEGEEAVLKSYRGYPDWWVSRVREIPYPKGFTWKTIIEGKPIYCADVDKDTVIAPAGREMGTKSYTSMPILFGGKAVGAININSLRKDAFDEEELQLLEVVAQQIEIAINNAQQAEALRRSEEALRKAKDELEIKVEERTAELRKANEQLLAEIAERKSAEEELKNSREQLRALGARQQSIREEERKQIAREVHDELAQALTGLKFDLSWLESRLSKTEIRARLPLLNKILNRIQSMSSIIDTTIETVRGIALKLRPRVLDELGLAAAIEWQLQDFQKRTGIKCKLASSVEYISLDQDRSTVVFRIFQETLTNIARHANATKVNIRLMGDNGNIILKVEDNGRGITEKEISDSKSLGLLGMRERAFLLGGEVNIIGRPKKGTKVTVLIPDVTP